MSKNLISFEEWVNSIFDHSASDPEWYWNEDKLLELWRVENSPQILSRYIKMSFEQIETISEHFNNLQMSRGLSYLLDPAISGAVGIIFNLGNDIELQERIACINSFYNVYQKLFAIRCSPYLCSQFGEHNNPLNTTCYMWWDILPTYGHPNNPHYFMIDRTILQLLREILEVNSEPCQESALHGLSEWQSYYPNDVKEIIDNFLEKNSQISHGLRSYALKARYGDVL